MKRKKSGAETRLLGGFIMSQNQLRIEQYATVLFNANLNPLGIPETARRAIAENISSIVKYPEAYHNKLLQSVASYADVPMEHVITGNGSSDMIRLFTALVSPQKAMVLLPGPSEYQAVLKSYNCDIVHYQLDEENDFNLDMSDFISKLDSSIDLIMIANPTSRKIEPEDMEMLVEACESLGIFLVIDEMYIEFMDDYKKYTAVPLTKDHENVAVLRSVSKFFAVPGLRFAYAIMNNPVYKQVIDITTTNTNIATLSAIAVTEMLSDKKYIEDSISMIHTERNLVYAAMATSRAIKLTQPDANFMLCKLLNPDVNSSTVADHCNQRGVIIRKCDNIPGLSDRYIRFCFMKPKQNDLMVNTILEVV